METNITETLKTVAKDILSEDVLKEIESAFNSSVDEKVKLHVEKALIEQDEDYSKKLETLIEAIDADHTNKLKKVVGAIDADRAVKLKTVVEKYQKVLNDEASSFKNTLVENISKYLENYIDEKLPMADINEAVKNRRAVAVLENFRKMLSVDMIMASEGIRDAVIDGKTKIDEAVNQLEVANKEINNLSEENKKLKAAVLLETKVSDLDEKQKKYMKRMLSQKSYEFIKENFDYTLKMLDTAEVERLGNLKREAITETVTKEVDRPVVAESAELKDENDPSFNSYLSELGKY